MSTSRRNTPTTGTLTMAGHTRPTHAARRFRTGRTEALVEGQWTVVKDRALAATFTAS